MIYEGNIRLKLDLEHQVPAVEFYEGSKLIYDVPLYLCRGQERMDEWLFQLRGKSWTQAPGLIEEFLYLVAVGLGQVYEVAA